MTALADNSRNPAPEQSEHDGNAARIRALEAAVLDLLQRVQHLEAEAADRRFAQALRAVA